MKWIKDRPIKLGYYWERWCGYSVPTIIHLVEIGSRVQVDYGAKVVPDIDLYFEDREEYEWAGPISDPV